MEINNAFEVPLPPQQTWDVLMDIPSIAPCMPGAELTGVVDPDTYTGKVSVKLGPVALAFAGQVKFTEKDEANLKARVKGQGKDSKGRGGANATVDFHIEPAGSGSKVLVKTDLTLSGAVAQYGRASGMIQDVASQLIGQFAEALRAQLAHRQAVTAAQAQAITPDMATIVPPPPPPPQQKPISGFSLIGKALWNAIRRLFGAKV